VARVLESPGSHLAAIVETRSTRADHRALRGRQAAVEPAGLLTPARTARRPTRSSTPPSAQAPSARPPEVDRRARVTREMTLDEWQTARSREPYPAGEAKAVYVLSIRHNTRVVLPGHQALAWPANVDPFMLTSPDRRCTQAASRGTAQSDGRMGACSPLLPR